MRLLIITQAVDQDDPVLGFFHRWIEEFSERFERVHVVCLKEGRHALPPNVTVHSLGKDTGRSRFGYILNFYRYIWSLHREYDAVFVHMNPEYVVLGWKFWFLLRKKIYLWRNHYSGGFLTVLAVLMSKKVFCTSRSSFTAKFKKTTLMPVGVDTVHTSVQRTPRSILFLARFAPSKRPDVLLRALKILAQRGVQFSASFYGSPLQKDEDFARTVQREATDVPNITFYPSVKNRDTPSLYAAHDIFVNLSGSGMYDKTMFEAAAQGCLVVASSRDFAELVEPRFIFEENSAEDLARTLESVLGLSNAEKEMARAKFTLLAVRQSIESLAEKLVAEMR